jgi:uncharacterized protein (TIGR02246 family)
MVRRCGGRCLTTLLRLTLSDTTATGAKSSATGRWKKLPQSKEKIMKTRLLLTFAGLTICFAMPALALSGDLAGDVKALDLLSALSMKYDDAYRKKDATALAALFTEDALCVTPHGQFSGRQAIEKAYADDLQRWPASSHIYQADELNAICNEAWSVGHWWLTLQDQKGPVFARGYWSALLVREADGWKFRMLTFNETSTPSEPARAQ